MKLCWFFGLIMVRATGPFNVRSFAPINYPRILPPVLKPVLVAVRSLPDAEDNTLGAIARRFVGGRLSQFESAHQAKLPGFAPFVNPRSALDQQQSVECVPARLKPTEDLCQRRESAGNERVERCDF